MSIGPDFAATFPRVTQEYVDLRTISVVRAIGTDAISLAHNQAQLDIELISNLTEEESALYWAQAEALGSDPQASERFDSTPEGKLVEAQVAFDRTAKALFGNLGEYSLNYVFPGVLGLVKERPLLTRGHVDFMHLNIEATPVKPLRMTKSWLFDAQTTQLPINDTDVAILEEAVEQLRAVNVLLQLEADTADEDS